MSRSATTTAVIVNYNTREHLVACVASLRTDGIDAIVVVDNASGDGSLAALASADPTALGVPTGANLGFGAAANRGVAMSSSDYVLIMNPDTVVGPGMVKVLADALDGDPGLAIVGPRVENPDGTIYPSARRFPSMSVAIGHAFCGFIAPRNAWSRRYKMLDWDHRSRRDVDWVSGTCMLVRRSVFCELGGFDEGYFMYVEDVDLCWRAWQAGWRVGYEPDGVIVHVVGVSSELAPYRMILAHHRSLWRFAVATAVGGQRAALPAVGAGLVMRTGLAWIQRALRHRPHAAA